MPLLRLLDPVQRDDPVLRTLLPVTLPKPFMRVTSWAAILSLPCGQLVDLHRQSPELQRLLSDQRSRLKHLQLIVAHCLSLM